VTDQRAGGERPGGPTDQAGVPAAAQPLPRRGEQAADGDTDPGEDEQQRHGRPARPDVSGQQRKVLVERPPSGGDGGDQQHRRAHRPVGVRLGQPAPQGDPPAVFTVGGVGARPGGRLAVLR